MCDIATHMSETVGVRELRQNLSKYLERVKAGEALVVTERGRHVARLIPAGPGAERYTDLAERFGATVPIARLQDIAAERAMAALYVDTSAVGRILLGEPDAAAVQRDLGEFEQHVASRLLRIELRRLALREDVLTAADRLLTGVALVPLDDASSRRPSRCRRRPSRHSTPSTSPPRSSWPTRTSSTRS
jgi:prevent-host-death family protein